MGLTHSEYRALPPAEKRKQFKANLEYLGFSTKLCRKCSRRIGNVKWECFHRQAKSIVEGQCRK